VAAEKRKILIVEDSPTMCSLYRMVLGVRRETELIFASNGVEGLDRVAQEPRLQLMIVDINLPQMDGLEFLRRARDELDAASIPAIVISTEGDPADFDAARRAGAAAYLRKPWTPDQLLEAIDRLLAGATPE
jgi:two-component system, chemotaxis family, chemotaxis protein CheY